MAGMLAAKVFNVSSLRRTSVRAAAATATPAISFPVRTEREKTLYDTLRVKETASRDEIKTAYRSLAKLAHPDATSSGGFEQFVEIRRAYETLSDPKARATYDKSIGKIVKHYGAGFWRFGSTRWETDQCW